jgi:hypothetical protein
MKVKRINPTCSLNEHIDKTLFNDFYCCLYINTAFKDPMLKEYFKRELALFPDVKKHYEQLPIVFARELLDDIMPPVFLEFSHVFERFSGIDSVEDSSELDALKKVYDYSSNYSHEEFIGLSKEFHSASKKQKEHAKIQNVMKGIDNLINYIEINKNNLPGSFGYSLESVKRLRKKGKYEIVRLMIRTFLIPQEFSDDNLKKYSELLKTVPFYNDDDITEYKKEYDENIHWDQYYGGEGWGVLAWLMLRLMRFVDGVERTSDIWEQISLLTNAIMMIQHNSGNIIAKFKNFEDTWQPGINIKSFAVSASEFSPVSNKVEKIKELAENALRQYKKHNVIYGEKAENPLIRSKVGEQIEALTTAVRTILQYRLQNSRFKNNDISKWLLQYFPIVAIKNIFRVGISNINKKSKEKIAYDIYEQLCDIAGFYKYNLKSCGIKEVIIDAVVEKTIDIIINKIKNK